MLFSNEKILLHLLQAGVLAALLCQMTALFVKYFPQSLLQSEEAAVLRERVFLGKKEETALFFLYFAVLCSAPCGRWTLLAALLPLLFLQSFWDSIYLALSDCCTVLLALAGLFSGGTLSKGNGLFQRLAAALAVLLLWFLLAFFAALQRAECPIGMGDAKLIAAFALLCGFAGLLHIFAAASIGAGLFAFLLLLFKNAKQGDRMAFGPFLCLGSLDYLLSVSYI